MFSFIMCYETQTNAQPLAIIIILFSPNVSKDNFQFIPKPFILFYPLNQCCETQIVAQMLKFLSFFSHQM